MPRSCQFSQALDILPTDGGGQCLGHRITHSSMPRSCQFSQALDILPADGGGQCLGHRHGINVCSPKGGRGGDWSCVTGPITESGGRKPAGLLGALGGTGCVDGTEGSETPRHENWTSGHGENNYLPVGARTHTGDC